MGQNNSISGLAGNSQWTQGQKVAVIPQLWGAQRLSCITQGGLLLSICPITVQLSYGDGMQYQTY